MQRTIWHLRRRRARGYAIVASVALLAAGLAVFTPGVANAQSGYEQIILAHDTGWGMYAADGVVQNSPIAVHASWGTWVGNNAGPTNEDGVSGTGYTFEAVTTNGNELNWCLADTDEDGQAQLENCQAGGTVFIPVYNDGGYYLYSRYFLNLGRQEVLAVTTPPGLCGCGTAVEVIPVSQLNSNWYYRWAFLPG
jgi:hypothetical protein